MYRYMWHGCKLDWVLLLKMSSWSWELYSQYSANEVRSYIHIQIEWLSMSGCRCIFLPRNGAFFVNYVITSAFIGNALTLIRFPELTMYVLRMLATRSAYEMSAVRRVRQLWQAMSSKSNTSNLNLFWFQSVLWEFQFGQEYAWMLCNFTVVMAYSILSPLVTVFGKFCLSASGESCIVRLITISEKSCSAFLQSRSYTVA